MGVVTPAPSGEVPAPNGADLKAKKSRYWPPEKDGDWTDEMTAALNRRQKEKPEGHVDVARREALGTAMVEMGLRAWKGRHENSVGQSAWTITSWLLGLLTVITSAVAASVLLADLSGLKKWIVGGASLIGAIVSGMVTVWRPDQRSARGWTKYHQYEIFWRRARQYACSSLPYDDLSTAVSKLEDLRQDLNTIVLSGGPQTLFAGDQKAAATSVEALPR